NRWENVLADESTERREFIRAIDAVKKQTQRARKFAALTPDLPGRPATPTMTAEDRDAVRTAAQQLLGDRQQRILELTAAGWAVPEIATELQTTPERISDEKYKAIRKLQLHFQTAAPTPGI
ncbi:MAG: sigma-70 family RNA polymerase sigma factor, partial [Gemmataceae bacterium]